MCKISQSKRTKTVSNKAKQNSELNEYTLSKRTERDIIIVRSQLEVKEAF